MFVLFLLVCWFLGLFFSVSFICLALKKTYEVISVVLKNTANDTNILSFASKTYEERWYFLFLFHTHVCSGGGGKFISGVGGEEKLL